jgi:hypothetical protein
MVEIYCVSTKRGIQETEFTANDYGDDKDEGGRKERGKER